MSGKLVVEKETTKPIFGLKRALVVSKQYHKYAGG